MKTKKKKYRQYVVAEVHNGGTYIDLLESDKPIGITRAIEFYEKKEEFDWEEDGITLVNPEDIAIINLDKK